jgi:hypothetical protein
LEVNRLLAVFGYAVNFFGNIYYHDGNICGVIIGKAPRGLAGYPRTDG